MEDEEGGEGLQHGPPGLLVWGIRERGREGEGGRGRKGEGGGREGGGRGREGGRDGWEGVGRDSSMEDSRKG